MSIHPYPINNAIPPAVGQHPQPIILKVSKTISPSRDHFHFVVEPFGDAVAFAEAPHGDDRLQPAGQCPK
jgi:hypothetical protein